MAGGLLALVVGIVLSMGDLFFILRVGGILTISWVLLLMTGGFFINHRWWKPILQIFMTISILLVSVIGGVILKSS